MATANELGVTVVAGFLGAGKTTLVNHLLQHADGRRLGVMVNDFGALNIDEALVDERRDDLIALSNGCVCCSLQGELASAVQALVERRGSQLDHLLIECSGVSDPERVVNVLGYPRIRRRARLEGVITLVDASLDYVELSPALRHLVASQIDNADLVIFNKVDLVDDFTLSELEKTILLPGARHIRTIQATLPADFVFWEPLTTSASPRCGDAAGVSPTDIAALGLLTLSWSHPGSVNVEGLQQLLRDLPREMLRFKGIVVLDDGRVLALQRAAGRVTSRELVHRDTVETQLAFIGEEDPALWAWLESRLSQLAESARRGE